MDYFKCLDSFCFLMMKTFLIFEMGLLWKFATFAVKVRLRVLRNYIINRLIGERHHNNLYKTSFQTKL